MRGTVAFVTGANRGIGAALVQELLEEGASKIYATARQHDDLEKMAAKDDRIVPIHLDITDGASAILHGVEADDEDIFPDPMAKHLYTQWAADHKGIERQFAAM